MCVYYRVWTCECRAPFFDIHFGFFYWWRWRIGDHSSSTVLLVMTDSADINCSALNGHLLCWIESTPVLHLWADRERDCEALRNLTCVDYLFHHMWRNKRTSRGIIVSFEEVKMFWKHCTWSGNTEDIDDGLWKKMSLLLLEMTNWRVLKMFCSKKCSTHVLIMKY